MKKRRITILTGAGFTSSSQFNGVSTKYLTEKIINYQNYEYYGRSKPILFIFREYCRYRGFVPDVNHPETQIFVNFETILNCLEIIDNNSNSYQKDPFFRNMNGAFLIFKDKIIRYILSNYKKKLTYSKSRESYISSWAFSLISQLYSLIINELATFINDSQNIGMLSFKNNFLEPLISDNSIIRMYTLNYDNWINKYCNFYDGFNEENLLNSDSVCNNRDIDCHYNLHGCITWRIEETRFVKNMNELYVPAYTSFKNEWLFDHNSYINSNIISGGRKTEYTYNKPFNLFNSSFLFDVVQSDVLLIIGYGFLDFHINKTLSNYNGKLIIVDYHKNLMNGDIDKISNPQDRYLDVIGSIYEDMFVCPEDWNYSKNYLLYEDKRVLLWYAGIGEEFYNNFEKLCKILYK